MEERAPLETFEDGYMVNRLIDAAYESAAERKWIIPGSVGDYHDFRTIQSDLDEVLPDKSRLDCSPCRVILCKVGLVNLVHCPEIFDIAKIHAYANNIF